MANNVSWRRKFKSKKFQTVKNWILVIFGCAILAFGGAAFIEPWDIVSGGVLSVGVIINHFVEPIFNFNVTDIVVAVVQGILWLVGLLVLGRQFALKTLAGLIAYPLFYALFYRLKVGYAMGLDALYPVLSTSSSIDNSEVANLTLCALFGGILTGVGVAIAYLGSGSTGGFDIISAILSKYHIIKEDISSLIIDASLVLIYALCQIGEAAVGIRTLVGILAAICCAMAIQYLYTSLDPFVVVDIISSKNDEIEDYIIDVMDHTTTRIEATGGYTGEKRTILRAIVNKDESGELQQKIASIDPSAFVTFTHVKTTNGEGFEPFFQPNNAKRKNKNDKKCASEASNEDADK